VIKKGRSVKKERPHPLAPKPFDREHVKRVLARMPMKKNDGDASGAEGLPLRTELPVGDRVVVEFWKVTDD